MTPAHVTRGHRRYRYYTCSGAQRKGWHTRPSKALPAAAIERYVREQLASDGSRGQGDPSTGPRQIRDRVARIDYDGTMGEVAITLIAPNSIRRDSA
jgi:hypothetical protein